MVDEWWEKIKDSRKFKENIDEIRRYQAGLKPGDVTLVGLIAEGGQGMASANNARFLGYLDGTVQSKTIRRKRIEWTQRWLNHPQVGPEFLRLLAMHGGDLDHPLANDAAWEAAVEALKGQSETMRNALGFQRNDLYRIVPPSLIVEEEDFQFAWRRRKAALLARWQQEPLLAGFWTQRIAEGIAFDPQPFRAKSAAEVEDRDFCMLCMTLQQWVIEENTRRKKVKGKHRPPPIPANIPGLRSSETYTDPADAPRIAAIYNGFAGSRVWAPFRKGDPSGNRWADDEPLYIDWREELVIWLFEHSGKSEKNMPVIRNAELFFTPGITWTRGANHVAIKAKSSSNCIMDVNALMLRSLVPDVISSNVLLAIFNSDILSYILKKYINHTWMVQISDLRMMPMVIPNAEQFERLDTLSEYATQAKRQTFQTAQPLPLPELSVFTRELAKTLWEQAPEYLRPNAQQQLLSTTADCLSIIELAINWEAEKLYGVEGEGPFDEF
jgi:hypothetical protein